MRTSVAAMALITRREQGQTLWLAQWNPNWQRYHFVGGHKRADESFRECVLREIAEELRLAKSDYFVAQQPRAHLDYTAWSHGAGEETEYTMELFDVQLTEAAQRQVDGDSRNRWVAEEEIRARRCESGEAVSETMELLLSRAKLLEPKMK